jgi:hypothetical protein
MAQIRLNLQQRHDLETICDLGDEVLRTTVKHISNLATIPLAASELHAEVERALGDKRRSTRSVMRQCLSLNDLMRQSGLNASAVVASITSWAKATPKWSQSQIDKWKSIEAVFRDLISLDAFRVVARALSLSYDYANLYLRAKIITDIRPLFSSDAETIDGAVVSYTLRLGIRNANGQNEMSVAMDEGDVLELAHQCDRALRKARVAQTLMTAKAGISTVITGEVHDA